MSKSDVDHVTGVAREVADVGRRAREVADGLKKNIGAVNDALDVAENLSRALGQAAGELRGALGAQTNNPPREKEEGKK